MKQPASFRRNCKPIGNSYTRPETVALEFRNRMRRFPEENPSLILALDRGYFYVTSTNSELSEKLTAEQIVGTYTSTSKASDIAADLYEFARERERT